jgi:DNA-directed RNA polymerase sigma subunit (sigma70/sigma32)
VIVNLNPKQRFVLDRHYNHGDTYRQIGAALHVSNVRAREIHQNAIRKIYWFLQWKVKDFDREDVLEIARDSLKS